MQHGQPPSRATTVRNRPVPERWIMIDRRLGDRAAAIVAAMPPRSGVIIRPYAMADAGRVQLIRAIVRAGKARRHVILWAGRQSPGFADGAHGGGPDRATGKPHRWLTLPVHNRQEARQAARLRATAILVSPVHTTASHPGGALLGPAKARQLAMMAGCPAIALGGMDASRFRRLRGAGFTGWAAIDAWSAKAAAPDQKRKRVPT